VVDTLSDPPVYEALAALDLATVSLLQQQQQFSAQSFGSYQLADQNRSNLDSALLGVLRSHLFSAQEMGVTTFDYRPLFLPGPVIESVKRLIQTLCLIRSSSSSSTPSHLSSSSSSSTWPHLHSSPTSSTLSHLLSTTTPTPTTSSGTPPPDRHSPRSRFSNLSQSARKLSAKIVTPITSSLHGPPKLPASPASVADGLKYLFQITDLPGPPIPLPGPGPKPGPVLALSPDEGPDGKLTRIGVEEVKRGVRMCSNLNVPKLCRDPSSYPIRSDEIAFLVRGLYSASDSINRTLHLGRYYRPLAIPMPESYSGARHLTGQLASAMLKADTGSVKELGTELYLGITAYILHQLDERLRRRVVVNLRPLASYSSLLFVGLFLAIFHLIVLAS